MTRGCVNSAWRRSAASSGVEEGRERLDGLMEAMLAVNSGLELDATCRPSSALPLRSSTRGTARSAYGRTTTWRPSSSRRASTTTPGR